MSILLLQRRRPSLTDLLLPEGSVILYDGDAADLNSIVGWELATELEDVFVRGNGSVDLTAKGGGSHNHTNPNTNSTNNGHTHGIDNSGTTGTAGGAHHPSLDQNYSSIRSHHHEKASGSSNTGGGSHTHSIGNTGSSSPVPPFIRLYWIKATMDAPVPVGGIIMFSKPYSQRPPGFVICNGSGITPDMRDKFVLGAANDGQVRDTGGSLEHNHSNPVVNAGGNHRHLVSGGTTGVFGDNSTSYQLDGPAAAVARSHGHNFSAYTSYQTHAHGLGNTHNANHLPKFVKLYYLMRTE